MFLLLIKRNFSWFWCNPKGVWVLRLFIDQRILVESHGFSLLQFTFILHSWIYTMYMDCNIVHSVILHLSFSCRNNISASDYSFNFEKSNQYTIGFFFFTIITTDNENYAYGLYHKWLILLVIRWNCGKITFISISENRRVVLKL